MGADGGSIAKRSDIVKPSAAPRPGATLQSANEFWTTCGFSGNILADPVASDWKGRLFDKKEILEYLLGYEKPAQLVKLIANDVASLRDIVELKRHIVNGKWQCKLTSKIIGEEGDATRFAYIPECGHVAHKPALETEAACPFCNTAFESLVVLNATGKDLEAAQIRIDRLRAAGKTHSMKPAKQRKPRDGAPQKKPKLAPAASEA